MEHFNWGLIVPLGAFVMVIIIVAINSMRKMRERELQAHQDLRVREMEHERRMKEMEIERAKLELERAKVIKTGGRGPPIACATQIRDISRRVTVMLSEAKHPRISLGKCGDPSLQ